MQEFLGFQFEIISNGRIKNYFLRYNAKGYLSFGFPLSAKNQLGFIKDYISANKDLIHTNLLKIQARQDSKQTYVQDYLKQHKDKLLIFGIYYESRELDIALLSQILYKKAKNMLDECATLMNLSYSKLTISYAKSYLGQCDSKNAIKIDYRVVLCDEVLLHYLIIHELAHIRYKNHSLAFWHEVAKYHPNYKISRKKLKIAANINTEILKYYNLLPKRLY